MLLFSWPDIVESLCVLVPFEERIILRLIVRAGVVEDDHPNCVAVAPEVLVILLDGLPHVAQAMGGDDEKRSFGWHEVVVADLLELLFGLRRKNPTFLHEPPSVMIGGKGCAARR